VADRLDAQPTRGRATAVPAHSVRDHEQPLAALGRKLAEGVLVLAPNLPDIACASALDPGHERLYAPPRGPVNAQAKA
jgi:hypothetical protein